MKNYKMGDRYNFSDYLSRGVMGEFYYNLKEAIRILPTIYHSHGSRWEEMLSQLDEWKYEHDHSSYGLPNIAHYHPDGWRLVSLNKYLYIVCDEHGGGAPTVWGKCKYYDKEIDLYLYLQKTR